MRTDADIASPAPARRRWFSGAAPKLLLWVVGMVIALYAVAHLKRMAHQVALDTLPGLSAAGEATASMGEEFNCTLQWLLATTPEQRLRLRHRIDVANRATSAALEGYKVSILTPRDRALFQNVRVKAANYAGVRDRIFRLVEEGRIEDGRKLATSELLPAFIEYKKAGDELFDFNMKEGVARGQAIMRFCTITRWVLAILCIGLFVVGFFTGSFDYTSRKNW